MMTMKIALRRCPLFIATLAPLMLPAFTLGQEESWVGYRIMPKQAGVRIRHSDPEGNQVYLAELTDFVYKVQREQGEFLHVRHRNAEGWVWKGEVVLMGDAVDYFAEQIRADRDDAFAFAHRGRAWQEEGEPERALRDLNEAIRLQPKKAAWYR